MKQGARHFFLSGPKLKLFHRFKKKKEKLKKLMRQPFIVAGQTCRGIRKTRPNVREFIDCRSATRTVGKQKMNR